MLAILSHAQYVNDRWTGLIQGLRPANERRRYFVTTPLIGTSLESALVEVRLRIIIWEVKVHLQGPLLFTNMD